MDRGRKRGCGANELPACGIGITPAFLTCQHLVVAVTTKHFKVQSEALLGSSVLTFSSVAGESPAIRVYGVVLTAPPRGPAFPGISVGTGIHVNVSRRTCALKLLYTVTGARLLLR